jgi:hypothetical protein
MKVKAFKIIPGVDYQGPDSQATANQDNSDEQHVPPAHIDRNTRRFMDRFVFSVDGERYNPGTGILCEVHQGLALFVCDSKMSTYQPVTLPNRGTVPTPRPPELVGKAFIAMVQSHTDAWLHEMEERLKLYDSHRNPVIGASQSSANETKETVETTDLSVDPEVNGGEVDMADPSCP